MEFSNTGIETLPPAFIPTLLTNDVSSCPVTLTSLFAVMLSLPRSVVILKPVTLINELAFSTAVPSVAVNSIPVTFASIPMD